MELLLGSHVREHGNRVGRLAAFELEPATRLVRRIVFSPDGDLGPQATMQPLASVALVHDDGELELRPYGNIEPMPAVGDVVLLSRATRLMSAGRIVGRLIGLEVQPGDRSIVAAYTRAHWLSRRHTFDGARLDFSTPGEIRIGPGASRAA